MSTIHTQWHKALELIKADQVHLTAPKKEPGMVEQPVAPHWSEYKMDRELFLASVEYYNELPRFVIDPELFGLVNKNDFNLSILDMKRAGVLRLPFPAMAIEIPPVRLPDGKIHPHVIVFLRDLKSERTFTYGDNRFNLEKDYDPRTDAEFEFYGIVFRLHKDEHGEYLVTSPSVPVLSVSDDPSNLAVSEQPWLKLQAQSAAYFASGEHINELVAKTAHKDAADVWRAVYAALLLMNTQGIKKEIVETQRLNKRRVQAKKAPIPQYTYITIGHVYRSNKDEDGSDKDEYIPRKSPRPHWRRGHNRGIRFGTNRAQLKIKYIKPRLVSFNPGEIVPPMNPIYQVKK